jgi:hypothetical protein
LRSLINARGDFLLTTFPVADISQTVTSPLVFPQVADGGGYQTQFILISPSAAGSSSTVSLDVPGDNGSKLLAAGPGEGEIDAGLPNSISWIASRRSAPGSASLDQAVLLSTGSGAAAADGQQQNLPVVGSPRRR